MSVLVLLLLGANFLCLLELALLQCLGPGFELPLQGDADDASLGLALYSGDCGARSLQRQLDI